mmetsp:Transcript_24902/g.48484  ORF Transcript_24902/g.48484 Transcript_24902/m.48484 type:complete len:475 (+) Transcript_24902:45-1469(+)
MESGQDALSAQHRQDLALFCEVTANARDSHSAQQLLQACNWNVEQALQLHWAGNDEDAEAQALGTAAAPPPAPHATPADSLGAPLLERPSAQADAEGDAGRGSLVQQADAPTSRNSFVDWIMSGIRRISLSVFTIVCTFIFGPGGPRLRGGASSGAAFGRALNAAYGAELQLPVFFSGSFAQALQAARLDVKLLVVYLHSENAQHTQSFCTQVLSNDYVCTMLNENFLLWGGDILRVETHFVAQMMHARQYPCFCVLLPANDDEIRVIGALHGEVQVDAAVALLTTCLEEMDAHRAEIVARREQHAEDRSLREQQDREYQEALEMDRRREEQQQLLEQEQRETQRLAEEQLRQEQEALSRIEAQQQELLERRQRQAAELAPESADATARISLRLPAGQRVQRKFATCATLKDVYAWADSAAYLPENKGRDLMVPDRFVLKTSFPTKDLVEMNSTVEDLQLAGTNIVLAAIEDDD